MSSRSVRTPGGSRRNYTVAKFRARMPQLSDSSSRVRMGVKKGELGEQQWALEVGCSTYEGTRERIGGTLGVAATSSYALFRMDPETGVLTLLPQGQEKKSGAQKTHEVEWYDFRPALTHETISMDDAIKAMDRQDHSGSRVKGRELKKLNQGDGDDDEAQAQEERTLDESDEFDDGADAAFRENKDEDGREGLDMENEDDIFDDDDDDFFAEDDEEAVESRLQAKQFGAGESTLAGVEANEEEQEADEGEEGVEGSDEWKKTSKEVLKAERRQRAKDDDDDDFDDDDDDDDEGEAALKALLSESGSAGTEAQEGGAASSEGKEGKRDEVKPEGAAAASTAPGKRKPSPGPDEPQAKRSRPDAPRKGRVTEKEVVGVLAEHGRMRLKDLINPFKPHIRNQEDKAEFMKMVKLIGKLIKDNGESYVVLNDAAKHKYGISD
tara:strand:+ start:257 stop:1573 length:1317 start_codon:yes stop_codon:yes gene_type:complete